MSFTELVFQTILAHSAYKSFFLIYARFLRFREGVKNLNNQKFKLLPASKRQRKLAAVLRYDGEDFFWEQLPVARQYRLLKKGSQSMCFRRQTPIYQIPMPPPERPDNEVDLLRRAFGLIQRRVTEHLAGAYPEARWVWETPNPRARIAAGEPVHIQLNRAGGYRRAEVQVVRLQFKGLKFDALPDPAAPLPEEEQPDEPGGTDYSLLAFEWVESHLPALNQRGNEAVAQGETEVTIGAEELPDPASWPEICAELMRSGFSEAAVTETGITTKLPQ